MEKRYKNKRFLKIRGIGFIALLLFLYAPFNIKSQITFEKLYGGHHWETAYKLAICHDKGYVTAGYTRSHGIGEADVHVIRTDKYGEMLWEVIIDGYANDEAYSVIATNDGHFVVVGKTRTFGNSDQDDDVFVIKIDDTGTVLWQNTYGGANTDEGWDVHETSAGDFIITGLTNSYGGGFVNAFLLKIDKDGNQKWLKTYGGDSFEGGFCVRETVDGGYVVLGRSHSYGNGQGKFYFFKTNGDGNQLWMKTYGGSEADEGRYLALTPDGGFILVGKTQSYGAGEDDIYVIKTDAEGNEEWNKTYGGDKKDTGKSIESTQDGGYIIAGSSRSFGWQVPWVWIIKTDSQGNIKWIRQYGSWDHDHGHHILPTEDGGYIATGHYNRDESKMEDTYLLKLDNNGQWNPDARDAGITDIFSPVNNGCADKEQLVSVQVKNYGNAPLSDISLSVELSGIVNQVLSETFNLTIAPGKSSILTFDEFVNTSGGGTLKMNAEVKISNDVYSNNNKLIFNDIQINNQPAPYINLGTKLEPEGSSYELDAGPDFKEYLWSTGETTRKIVVNNTGDYWVKVTDNNDCVAFSSVYVQFTGIEIHSLSASVKIFPNPSDGKFNIRFRKYSGSGYRIEILDVTGQIIHSESMIDPQSSIYTVDLTDLSPGVYLIKISGDKEMAVSRVVIK